MELVQQCPPPTVSEESSPAYPYDGFFAILSEGDVTTAIEDQVLKLGPDFDRTELAEFCRLLWLLNDTTRHKTFQAYLRFTDGNSENTGGFVSEILLCPFDAESRQFVIGLDDITRMAFDFKTRLTKATASADNKRDCSIRLTPLRTKFGVRPQPPTWGYSLRLRAETFADSPHQAVARWKALIGAMNKAFEKS